MLFLLKRGDGLDPADYKGRADAASEAIPRAKSDPADRAS